MPEVGSVESLSFPFTFRVVFADLIFPRAGKIFLCPSVQSCNRTVFRAVIFNRTRYEKVFVYVLVCCVGVLCVRFKPPFCSLTSIYSSVSVSTRRTASTANRV